MSKKSLISENAVHNTTLHYTTSHSFIIAVSICSRIHWDHIIMLQYCFPPLIISSTVSSNLVCYHRHWHRRRILLVSLISASSQMSITHYAHAHIYPCIQYHIRVDDEFYQLHADVNDNIDVYLHDTDDRNVWDWTGQYERSNQIEWLMYYCR